MRRPVDIGAALLGLDWTRSVAALPDSLPSKSREAVILDGSMAWGSLYIIVRRGRLHREAWLTHLSPLFHQRQVTTCDVLAFWAVGPGACGLAVLHRRTQEAKSTLEGLAQRGRAAEMLEPEVRDAVGRKRPAPRQSEAQGQAAKNSAREEAWPNVWAGAAHRRPRLGGSCRSVNLRCRLALPWPAWRMLAGLPAGPPRVLGSLGEPEPPPASATARTISAGRLGRGPGSPFLGPQPARTGPGGRGWPRANAAAGIRTGARHCPPAQSAPTPAQEACGVQDAVRHDLCAGGGGARRRRRPCWRRGAACCRPTGTTMAHAAASTSAAAAAASAAAALAAVCEVHALVAAATAAL